jgi:hypothetical protein
MTPHMPVSTRGDPFKAFAQMRNNKMRTQRPGTFKKGHKKMGGRKKGTPNLFNKDLIQAIVQAAEQVGSDGKGKNGVDGYLQRLAGKKEGYFVSLLRQAVQKQVPATERENEIVYATEQDFRQALLDHGVHPTLLPPPPRDPDEKPPTHLNPPKPPPGWEYVLWKTNESAALEKEQPDPIAQSDLGAEEAAELDKEQPDPIARLKAELDQISRETEDQIFREIKDPDDPGSPWNPAPGWRFEYNPYNKCFFPHRK